MCGIAGIINYRDIDFNIILSSLKHRGPDAQTIWHDDRVALLHTRLAIQDVAHGVQPFHYQNYSIIFNGEIYNHIELRKLLSEFTFKTTSDTETLLYLFIKYQHNMYDFIDGMFAFAIYDKNNHKIILARDRAGKKPIYYYHNNNRFIFASELNAIKSVCQLSISNNVISSYLRAGFIWTPYTAYSDVYKLEAGSYLVVDIDTLNIQKHTYFNILNLYDSKNSQIVNLQDALVKLESKFEKSVADRITASDVEVGVFLSGGIDSNLIAAFSAKIKPNIKTFTVKFDGLYDESPLAKLTAQKYQTDHIELSISTNLKNDIEKILCSYGEPFMDSSAIPSYYVSREASKYVKVVLAGDGADELFAGYRRYVPARYSLNSYARLFSVFLRYFPKPTHKQSIYNYFYRLLTMSNKTGLDHYLSGTTDVFEDAIVIQNNSITRELEHFIQSILTDSTLSSLNKMLYADYSAILFCDLLVKMDIASMANSLEVRSPFLSKYMLEFAPSLSDHFKINKFKTKYLLRKLAERYLPKELINQPKRGFEVPLRQWVDQNLRENIRDSLKANSFASCFVEDKLIQNLLNNKIDVAPEKRAKMLWSLYCLEVWYQNETKNSLHRKLPEFADQL